jgi:hypothetical protein
MIDLDRLWVGRSLGGKGEGRSRYQTDAETQQRKQRFTLSRKSKKKNRDQKV